MDELFPDGEYRPIPIVWAAGAFVIQALALFVTFFALYAFDPLYTAAAAGLISILIGRWTWRRGMSRAPWGWKGATLAVLVANWALVSLGAQDRIPFRDPPGTPPTIAEEAPRTF
jgi:hypothetical protein